jgi:acetyl-CoA synthetase
VPKKNKSLIFSENQSLLLLKNETLVNDELKTVSIINTPEVVDTEDPLFVLYTSGSTGKPKGIIHAAGGYMVYALYTFKKVFGYKSGEIFWCTADLGWITGHTYGVYGPLLTGATIVMFEGIPTYPTPSRYWEIIEKYKVNIFYTAPTVIRYLESFGLNYIKEFKLKSLRLIGSVGEPLNVEAWHWYHKNVGKERCKIVDTWWQTETGGIMLSPQKSFKSTPGSVGVPLPGIEVALLDNEGKEITEPKNFGSLCIKKPWPGMSVGILNDKQRFFKTYLSQFKGYYFTGDVARKDENGQYYIYGRIDDVINVSGHRLGSAEIESAINFHPDIVESSVVGYPHAIKGSDLYAFVILRNERLDAEVFKTELSEHVKETIGHIAALGKIQIVKGLPKTRSGKIVRRILRRLVSGDSCEQEDVTTLTDINIITEIKKDLLL